MRTTANQGADPDRRDASVESYWTSHGLFVIWEAARPDEARILDDLGHRFEVRRVIEIEWTPRMVRRNFERFYADMDVRGVYHLHNKGAGRFLAVGVFDPAARIERQLTPRGWRPIQSRFREAKTCYREWTAEYAVHCSETPWEARRDVGMLLGDRWDPAAPDAGPWDGVVEFVSTDVAGARGWGSMQEMLVAADRAVDYSIVGPRASSASQIECERLRIVTDDCAMLRAVLDTRPRGGSDRRRGGDFRVMVAGRRLPVTIHDSQDPHRFRRGRVLWARELASSVYVEARDRILTHAPSLRRLKGAVRASPR